jgi:hypothetical protein
MPLPLHSDGCIIADPTQRYRAIFAPKCPHTKIRSAVIEFDSPGKDLAVEYAEQWINLPQMYLESLDLVED